MRRFWRRLLADIREYADRERAIRRSIARGARKTSGRIV